MEEQLLHFIWHRKLFNLAELSTTTNERIDIIHSGIPNQDQGPDFLQSRIRIGEQLWAGHVEIHIRSSAWYLHTHDQDPHYNNVILHVVWEEDQPVYDQYQYRIPCLELAKRVDLSLLERYRHLMNNEEWIPCASALGQVSEIIRTSWQERLMAERLERKTEYIARIFDRCRQDWEQTFFVILSRQLGAPANAEAMENLAISMSLNLLRKHKDRPDQIEALLFGAAGMVGKELNADYPKQLKKEFDFLRKKYNLLPMQALQWKFMRMRPPHFPTMRIAQLAVILAETDHFISAMESDLSAGNWIKRFCVKPRDEFWDHHYHFIAATPPAPKRLGTSTAISLVINVVAPVMFIYGKHQGNPQLKERAINLLEELPAEKNGVITGWQHCGWHAKNAGQTQALLHLKKEYCDKRRCLHCAIGMQVIK